MRKHPTEAEAALWSLLKRDTLGVRFRRQYPVGGHILDFYCPEYQLAIEVDGGYHKKHKILDQDRDRDEVLMQEHGIRTLRVTNEQVLHNGAHVVTIITDAIRSTPPPSEEGLGVEVSIRIPRNLVRAIVPKGSIALDGVSLTVASLDEDICTVALIPHTLAHTTLGILKEGDRVNVETDVLIRSRIS